METDLRIQTDTSILLLPMNALTADEMQQIMNRVSAIVINLSALDQQLNPIANVLVVELVVNKLHPYLRELWTSEKNKIVTSTWEELEKFLEKHRRIKQQLEEHDKLHHPIADTKRNRTLLSQSCQACPMCRHNHSIAECGEFQKLLVDQRVQIVGRLRLCYKCLQMSGHSARHCQSKRGCSCHGNHHKLLHGGQFGKPRDQPTLSPLKQSTMTPRGAPEALLTTAVVTVLDKESKIHYCRAIIDTASHSSFMTKSLASKLRLKEQIVESVTTGLGGMVTATTNKLVTTLIGSRLSTYDEVVEFNVTPHITDPVPTQDFAIDDWKIPRECSLADPTFGTSNSVDMLLSADVFYNALKSGLIRTPKATLLNSEFGWIVGGSQPRLSRVNLMTRPTLLKPCNRTRKRKMKSEKPARSQLKGVPTTKSMSLKNKCSQQQQGSSLKAHWYYKRVKKHADRLMRCNQEENLQRDSNSLVRKVKIGISDRAVTKVQLVPCRHYYKQHFYET